VIFPPFFFLWADPGRIRGRRGAGLPPLFSLRRPAKLGGPLPAGVFFFFSPFGRTWNVLSGTGGPQAFFFLFSFFAPRFEERRAGLQAGADTKDSLFFFFSTALYRRAKTRRAPSTSLDARAVPGPPFFFPPLYAGGEVAPAHLKADCSGGSPARPPLLFFVIPQG